MISFFNNRRSAKISASTVILLLICFIAVMFQSTAPGNGANVQLVEVAQGKALKKLAAELVGNRIIRSASIFVGFARLRGDDSRIKAGIYQLHDGMSMSDILNKLVAGDIYSQKFAVPEGYSIFQVAEMLGRRGIMDKETFLKACFDKKLLQELGIAGPSVEGYLYPSTYDITPKMNEQEVIRLMVGQFEKVHGQKLGERAKGAGLRNRDVIILASIIEKEAVVASERPLIASVFLNRLKKRMPLQSDPTATYGIRAFGGKVSKADILKGTPYNTYRIQGLPPGPIGNPSSSAIDAVMNPAVSNYLYFVAKKDGFHQFSATLDEHNRAVRHFLR